MKLEMNSWIHSYSNTRLCSPPGGNGFFSDALGPVPGNQLAVERISWHAGKVLRALLQFRCLFSLWGSLRILRVLNESSTMKIMASVLMKDIRVWLQSELRFSCRRTRFYILTSARENHPTREKATRGGERERLAFLAWSDFHARSRFARSTIPEEKWGTTRSLHFNYWAP